MSLVTYTGKRVDPEALRREDVSAQDIATALSRFPVPISGHGLMYCSVAQLSCIAAWKELKRLDKKKPKLILLQAVKRNALWLLTFRASLAYVGQFSSDRLILQVASTIYGRFGLSDDGCNYGPPVDVIKLWQHTEEEVITYLCPKREKRSAPPAGFSEITPNDARDWWLATLEATRCR